MTFDNEPAKIEKPLNPVYVKQANAFINIIGNNMVKYQKQFYNLAYSKKVFCRASVDDIFSETLVRVYESIKRNGITEFEKYANNGFSAYFQQSLSNALIMYGMNKVKQREQREVQHALTNLTHKGMNEEYYVMLITSPAPIVDEADIDETEREIIYSEMVRDIKLKNAFNSLPQHFKDVLNLRYDGIKYKEIARLLSIPITTVKTRLNTARNILKNIVK